jgi:predicted nucleotidyltransferase
MFKVYLNKDDVKKSIVTTDIQYLKEPDFLCIVGSRLYGTSNDDSDLDIRGFSFVPNKLALGIKKFEQHQNLTDGDDTVVWSAEKYVKMLMSGSTIAFEMLFCPDSHIIRCSDLARELLSHKTYYISRRTITSMLGYGKNEWRKVKGEVTRDLGEKRKKHIEERGYSYKNAYHALRILDSGLSLAKYKTMKFPVDGYEFYKAIKNGDVDFKDIEPLYERSLAGLEALLDDMPKEQEINKVNDLLVRLSIKNILREVIKNI